MGAHARHAREWSGDFPLQPLRVRGFLVSNYFCIMASA
jgi:hypothetical protein